VESENSLQSSAAEKLGESYGVETVSLVDLLKDHCAPNYIDFISIDVEGTEFDILNNFSFNEYKFGLMSIEHHEAREEENIKTLMSCIGYKQIFWSISEFDGWYVSEGTKI
jgi:regulator of RNase E activity RraB